MREFCSFKHYSNINEFYLFLSFFLPLFHFLHFSFFHLHSFIHGKHEIYDGIKAMSPSTHNFFSVSQSLNPIDSSLLNCTKPWPLDWPEALIEILQDRIFPISYNTLLFLPSPPMFFCLFSPPILMGCCCCSNLEAIKTL